MYMCIVYMLESVNVYSKAFKSKCFMLQTLLESFFADSHGFFDWFPLYYIVPYILHNCELYFNLQLNYLLIIELHNKSSVLIFFLNSYI